MKLLIVTQVVDRYDPVLGFFHRWIEEFAKHVESVEVICLKKGEFSLPGNVKVYSLGKEKGEKGKMVYGLRFLRLAWKLRRSYDTVFVHMNPEYVVLGGGLWRMLGKRVALWYMHKSVPLSLQLATPLAHVVFTASPQSMRVQTTKKRVVGHGIDLSKLALLVPPPYPPLELITVGRLSPVKRTDVLIKACRILTDRNIQVHLSVIGTSAGVQGSKYEEELHRLVEGLNLKEQVTFVGAIPHSDLPYWLARSHMFLHASDTGSLDKASLEPLACGVPLITVDKELATAAMPGIIEASPTPEAFADAVIRAAEGELWSQTPVREELRAFVTHAHSLESLVPRLLVIVAS
jgi:glycosyltransferase involved in cell wall biosynthesis